MSFAVGEVVMLKSGGPRMTVTYCGDSEVGCTWFNKDMTPVWHRFPPASLKATTEAEEATENHTIRILRESGSFDE